MLSHSCQNHPVAGHARATGREDTIPPQTSISLRCWRAQRSLAGRILGSYVLLSLNCLSRRQGPLAQTPKPKTWTLENTFSLALTTPPAEPPNSPQIPQKSIPCLYLLLQPMNHDRCLSSDKEPHTDTLSRTQY